MNKQKIKNKLLINHFISDSYLKKICIIFENGLKIVAAKVKNKQDFLNYVAPLNNFYKKAFLLFPQFSFSTKKFNNAVDLIFINSKFEIIDLYQNVLNYQTFNFGFNVYSILILEKGFIKLNNIKKNTKIKLSSISNV